MVSIVLTVEKLSVAYGRVHVLWGVSLNVKERSITALIGSNGAGKSTTLNTIAGLVHPLEGKIIFENRDITKYPIELRVQEGFSLVPEGRDIWPALSVMENLVYGAFNKRARKNFKDTLESVFQLFPILKERIKQQGGSLSGGEQQMLAIGRGLMSKPKLLMLDEPSLGLMPKMVTKIFSLIKELRETGVTIFLVEQNVQQTLEIVDEAYVLETGRITTFGPGKTLLNNDHVKKAYLGL